MQQGPRPLPLFLDMLRSETAADPERRAAALAGLAAYQTARRPAPAPPRPVGPRVGRVVLRDGGGSGRPVLFVPSLINPPGILDMPGRSLLALVAGAGCRAWLLDWSEPDAADGALDLTQHVERFLLPLVAALTEPPVLVGYCLGGTLAIAAACATRVAGVATIAAPWHFGGYDMSAREAMLALWSNASAAARALGVLPMEALQAGFWQLDPGRTIDKFVAFPTLSPAARDSFVWLEDWANAGPPLPHAVARQLFEAFVATDLPGRGAWHVGGRPADPAALDCPGIAFVSSSDRIVPAATSPTLAEVRTTRAGHVGMVVGSAAEDALHHPLLDWIARLPAAG